MTGPIRRPFPKRPRLPDDAYQNAEAVFHVVVRAFPQTTPFDGQLGNAVWDAILRLEPGTWFVPVAACLIPDHLHLLLSPGRDDLRRGVASFKSYTTVLARTLGTRRLWQPGFFDRRIRDDAEFEATLDYIRQNPIEAGLATEPEAWPHLALWERAYR